MSRSKPIESVLPLLIDLQQNLRDDVSLETLARDVGYSPFHFHRLFTAAVGETPQKHVARLRLERAAYKLAITEDGVLDIGLAVGFNSHETFSRAFKRKFDRSPSEYRQAAKSAQAERLQRNRDFRGDGCLLSEVRFSTVKPTPLLAIRRLGAYAEFDSAARARLWSEIIDWAGRNAITIGPLRLGLFPDDPVMTPKAQQRADICISVERPVTGNDRIRCIEMAGDVYGVIEHIGPLSTVGQAYRNLADGIRASAYAFREDPPVQIFHTAEMENEDAANHCEVWFPVRKAS
ncbi:MAG: helix-turn-helix domain-containing protein [Pseudomonadota bacterium]